MFVRIFLHPASIAIKLYIAREHVSSATPAACACAGLRVVRRAQNVTGEEDNSSTVRSLRKNKYILSKYLTK